MIESTRGNYCSNCRESGEESGLGCWYHCYKEVKRLRLSHFILFMRDLFYGSSCSNVFGYCRCTIGSEGGQVTYSIYCMSLTFGGLWWISHANLDSNGSCVLVPWQLSKWLLILCHVHLIVTLMIKSTISKLTSEHARTLIDWNLPKPHSRKTNPSSGFAIAADIPGLQVFFFFISHYKTLTTNSLAFLKAKRKLWFLELHHPAHTVPK